ncbi:MAG: hypothetical protein E7617_01950 [Ruminococcaceae bacterium]|nr:hypothetical protein [Oscillospiraceae bacterium]
MKNTKRILIFIGAVVLLASMVFATVSAAATDSVIAGADTSYDEYLNMKLIVSHGFEQLANGHIYYLGNMKKSLGVANAGESFDSTKVGVVTPVNNFWQGVSSVYNSAFSGQFYMMDYNWNNPEGHTNDDGSKRPGDLYIQPWFGVLDDVEKTPQNGFVSEFDIAFFSEVVYVMTEKLDDEGNVVMVDKRDENGRIIYEIEVDEYGDVIYELAKDDQGFYIQVPETDSNGNIIYEKDENGDDIEDENGNKTPVYLYKKDADGNYIRDERGKLIPVYEPLKDSQGNPIPKYVCELDEEGNPKYEMDGEAVKTYSNGSPIPVKVSVKVPEMTYAMEDLLVPLTDENGKIVFNEDGSMKYLPEYEEIKDTEGNVVKVEKKDENGNVIYVKQLDANGEPIKVRKVDREKSGEFKGLNKSFGIGMYNTHTYNDGKIDLMHFSTNAATRTVTLHAGGKEVHTFRADEWEHISVSYDAETMLTTVYVGKDERKPVYEIKAIDQAENYNMAYVNVYPLQFRMGCQSTTGRVGIDNMLAYQGTTIHDPEHLTKMTDDEKFIYSSIDTLGNNEMSATNRLQAYNEIERNIISNYYDMAAGKNLFPRENPNYADLVKSIEIFLEYYNNSKPEGESRGVYDLLIDAVKTENVLAFQGLVNNVGSVERTFANSSEIITKINLADNFVTKSGEYIDFTSAVYLQANASLMQYKDNYNRDMASQQFITYMNVFKSSYEGGASAARLQAHYDVAAAIRDSISNPADLKGSDKTNLSNAINRFDGGIGVVGAAELIRLKTFEHNSSRFVGMMSLLSSTSNGDWANSDASARKLWELALDIINENMYDPEYEGFRAAKSVFDSANAYFWDVLQKEHLDVIRGKLDAFNDPSASYVYKAGICLFVENYINDNIKTIDVENKEIAAEIAKNQSYKAQLDTLKDDYKNLLLQNATKFINTMKYASEFNTYADLKPLYDEATEYYYAMDLVGEGMDDYVVKYEQIREYIIATERACELFLVASGALENETDDDKIYGLLVQCYSCYDDLDATYSGIKEAKTVYNAACDEYISTSNAINAEIEDTVKLVGAVRGNWDIDSIVAFFVNLFN